MDPDIPLAPGRLPVLGHAWSLWRDPLRFLEDLQLTRTRTGQDMALVHLGRLPVVFLLSSERVHEVLVSRARSITKGRFFDKLQRLVGLGLATAGREKHRRDRPLVQQAFRPDRITAYAEEITRRAGELADSWHDGQVLRVDTAVTDWIAATLGRLMFDQEIGREAVATIRRDLPVMLESLLVRTVSPPAFDALPLPANRRFDAAAGRLHRVLDEVIAVARRRGVEPGARDLLSLLMTAHDPGTGAALDDEDLRDQLGSILFAGVETTAALIAWALYDISRHPEVEQRLADEIRAACPEGRVTQGHLRQLPYLDRVLTEVIRLHSVTVLMRRTIEETKIGGVVLPAGTELAFSLYAIYRDPDLFPDPHRFDPDRAHPPRGAFTPYGAGARKCIGDELATTEAAIALATILHRWRLRPTAGSEPRSARAAVPRPVDLRMTVSRRP